MTTIQIGDSKIKLPSDYTELSEHQICDILMERMLLNTYDSELYASKMEEILLILGVPVNDYCSLPIPERLALWKHFEWVKSFKLEKRPFISFSCDGQTFFLPIENFQTLTAIEYVMGLVFFSSFNAENQQMLFELVFTLCRPQRNDVKKFKKSLKWNGDVREEYNSIIAAERAEKFAKKLPAETAFAVYEYFSCQLKLFIDKYETLFEESADTKPVFSSGEGALAMLEDVAESNTFGDMNNVYGTPIETIFLFLKHKKIKAQLEEKEAQKMAQLDD